MAVLRAWKVLLLLPLLAAVLVHAIDVGSAGGRRNLATRSLVTHVQANSVAEHHKLEIHGHHHHHASLMASPARCVSDDTYRHPDYPEATCADSFSYMDENSRCSDWGDVVDPSTGLSANDACCECGGGTCLVAGDDLTWKCGTPESERALIKSSRSRWEQLFEMEPFQPLADETITKASSPSGEQLRRMQRYLAAHKNAAALSSTQAADKKNGYRTSAIKFKSAICINKLACAAIAEKLGPAPDAGALHFGTQNPIFGIHMGPPEVAGLILKSGEFQGGGIFEPPTKPFDPDVSKTSGYFGDTLYKSDQYCKVPFEGYKDVNRPDLGTEGGSCFAIFTVLTLTGPVKNRPELGPSEDGACFLGRHWRERPRLKCRQDVKMDLLYRFEPTGPLCKKSTGAQCLPFKEHDFGKSPFPYHEAVLRRSHHDPANQIGFIVEYERVVGAEGLLQRIKHFQCHDDDGEEVSVCSAVANNAVIDHVGLDTSSDEYAKYIATYNRMPEGPSGPWDFGHDAIWLYTYEKDGFSVYKPLNHAMREETAALTGFMTYAKQLYDALEKLPYKATDTAAGEFCFRALVDPPDTTDIAEFNTDRGYWMGAAVPMRAWRSFVSCSTNMNTAIKFCKKAKIGCVLFQMTVLSGRDVSEYSNFPQESELLLLPSTPFRVTRTYDVSEPGTADYGQAPKARIMWIEVEEERMDGGKCCERAGSQRTNLQPCDLCASGNSVAFDPTTILTGYEGATKEACMQGKGMCSEL